MSNNTIYTTAPGYGAIPTNYSNVFVSNGTSGGVWKNTTATSYTIPVSGTGSLNTVSIGDDTKRSSLQIKGDTNIEGNLVVQGTNITEILRSIQSQLGLLVPNPQMEAEFDRLRELGDQYRKLEALLKEQKQVWDILKKE
jgi:hypothetical protein